MTLGGSYQAHDFHSKHWRIQAGEAAWLLMYILCSILPILLNVKVRMREAVLMKGRGNDCYDQEVDIFVGD